VKWRWLLPRASRRVLLGAGVVLALMLFWMTAPLVLRRLAFFRVRQVELVGVKYLDAGRVLATLQLSPHASVFDDRDVLVRRLRALDGVADAAVLRRLPGSLQVVVREIEPVALATDPGGALAVVDADGRRLPYDPAAPSARVAAGAGFDLPVVQGDDTLVVGLLARMQAADPALFQTIATARRVTTRGAGGDIVLELGAGAGAGAGAGGSHRVLLARGAGPEVIQAVVLVARDLAAKAKPYAELDARFAGQIVVRRKAGREAHA
jgi:cell division septal protein FtsQ